MKKRRFPFAGFTLIELLVVVAIIAILASLALGTAGYIQRKAATSRAEAELQAIATALESYKADMGDYPMMTNVDLTRGWVDPPLTNNYILRMALGPKTTNELNPSGKIYFEFTKGMGTMPQDPFATNQSFLDAFGESWGYHYTTNGIGGTGSRMNGTNSGIYDLWSRAGTTNTAQWIKNW